MNRTSQFLFVVSLSCCAQAEQELQERIEILAPKQLLTAQYPAQSHQYADERYTFSLDRTIADRLVNVPGVSLNGQGGQFQSYAIRGFSRGRIRTEIDGIPILTDRRAGNAVSFIAPDLFSVGHIVKGPASALYGAQALGGVVSLSTQMADESSVSVSGQSGGAARYLTLKHHQGTFSTALAYQRQNNEKAPNGTNLHTQFERVSGLFRYQHEKNDITTTVSWLPSYGKNIGKSNLKYQISESSAYPHEFHSLAQLQVNGGNRWTAKVFHHFQDWDSTTEKFAQYDSITRYQSHTIGGQWLQAYNVKAWESHWGVDWLSRHDVKISSDYDLIELDPALASHIIANSLQGDEHNLALYNKNRWQWRNVKFDLGMRYDWVKQQARQAPSASDGQLNGSVGVTLQVNHQLELGFEVGSGFRYPTLSERFFYGQTPRGFVSGNQELKPETSLGSQLALNWAISDELRLQSSVYHYQLDNYIERVRLSDEQLSYQNVENAEISGIELELTWYHTQYIEHHFAYQHQSGEDKLGQTLADLHPEKLSWQALIDFDNWSVVNSVSHYFATDKVNETESSRNNFTLWHLSIDYQFSDNQSMALSVNNLTNQTYYASLDEDAALQPERNVRLSMTWHF